jgi:cell division protein FtsI/penicillin-binding protein 2
MLLSRRGFLLLVVYAGLFTLIIFRLLWLQTVTAYGDGEASRQLARSSVEQRRESVVLDQGRGRVLDRYGTILAGEQVRALLILPRVPQWDDELSQRVAAIIGIEQGIIDTQVRSADKPILIHNNFQKAPLILTDKQIEQLLHLKSPALRVVPYTRRYQQHPIAAHVIGYMGQNPEQLGKWYSSELNQGKMNQNDQMGSSGIERAFDRFLRGVEAFKYSYFVDGNSERLDGLQDRWIYPNNSFYPLQLVTTLDSKLQAATENMLDKQHMMEGAVVVLDVENSNVIVMASRPDFDPYAVQPELGNWRNRAITAEVPGSIFKTVVLAAALEDGVVKPGQKFQCSGVWNRYHLRCWVREGHGVLSLEQAYAQSCNVIMAQIAAKLNPGRLEEIAESLGLFQRIGWSTDILNSPWGEIKPFHQFDGEQSGQLFDQRTNFSDLGVMAQTGIGQRDVRLSPLQAANMVVTLLNGGQLQEPRIVTAIKHNNNRTMMEFPEHHIHRNLGKPRKSISASTARWLSEAMKLTVTTGTAKSLLKTPVEVAGKTGTAEIGAPVKHKVNQWFIGYTPIHRPKYAFAILVSNRSAGSQHQALEITDQLIRLLSH